MIKNFIRVLIFLVLLGTSSLFSSVYANEEDEVPLISEVLDCGEVGGAGGLADGNELQRYDLALARFPNALCNDGTGAIFYFRPYEGESNRNKWVVQLQGGGSCRTPDDCARRWCSEGTAFSITNMSTTPAPVIGIEGKGILARRDDNPFGQWNHVFVKYCDSSTWSGTRKNAVVTAAHPLTGEPVTFRIHFLGKRILDAVLLTLRRVGVSPLVYTLNGGNVAMPDLDEAETIVLAGASAGGSGVILNADDVEEQLRRHNTRCRGTGECPLDFRALIDSSFPPALEGLDFSTTIFCSSGPEPQVGLCSWEAFMEDEIENGGVALWRTRGDWSCETWHAQNMPGTEWQCADNGHVIRHHLTTPMFIRMGQTDELHSRNQIEAGFSIPGYGAMDLEGFKQLVRDQLLALAGIQETAHEGTDIHLVPGAFGPTCSTHETLRDPNDTYGVKILVGETSLAMFDVWANWVSGAEPSIVVTPADGSDVCPDD